MALMECPDCEGKFSSTAAACVHCGYDMTPHHAHERWTKKHPLERGWIVWADIGFTLLWVWVVVWIIWKAMPPIQRASYAAADCPDWARTVRHVHRRTDSALLDPRGLVL